MKDTVIFDTHRVIKRFISVGFTEEQAEVVCEEQKEIIESNLATKQDITEIHFKIENLRQETKQDITEIHFKIEKLRQETKQDITEIYLKIESLKKDISQIDFKIESLKQETKKDIENLKQETKKDIELSTKKMYIAIFSSIGFFVTLLKILQLLKL